MNKTLENKAADRVSKARTQLLLKTPFFGTLALRLIMVADWSIDTMATNGTEIRYNPEFTMQLSIPEVIGVIAHEVLHCALGHIWRLENRDIERANIAADYCVNEVLIDAGFNLPQGVLISDQKNKSFEARYAALPAKREPGKGPDGQGQGTPRKGQGQGQGQGNGNDRPHPSTWGRMEAPKPVTDAGNGNPADKPMTEIDWQVAVEQTARICKDAGTFAGNLLRQCRDTRKPVEDCWELLKRFVSQCVPSDYNWATPNRRYIHTGLIFPTLKSDAIGEIVVAIDTSGSVGSHAIANFLSHISVILDQYKPSKLHLIEVDTQVSKATEYDQYSDFSLVEVHGGGGTYFQPAFNWVADTLTTPPCCFIYLTDGYPADRCTDPGYPVIWAYCQHANTSDPEFGALIRLPVV